VGAVRWQTMGTFVRRGNSPRSSRSARDLRLRAIFHVRPTGTQPAAVYTLGSVAKDSDYRVLVNERGQILLDPVVAIAASEARLWESPALRGDTLLSGA
jgi:hypothetical protein